MADKPPAQKLQLKPGMTAALLHVPPGVRASLGVPPDARVVDDPAGSSFVLEFAATQTEAEERLRVLRPHLAEKTVMWLAYPKGSRAAGHDVNRDTIFAFARTIGLTAVANVAIDETWSALRLRPL